VLAKDCLADQIVAVSSGEQFLVEATMAAQILDGKATAAAIREEIAGEVRQWISAGGAVPCLTAVLVGDDPASHVYVRNKHRACQQAGIDGRIVRLPADARQKQLLDVVDSLNRDPAVHGILVQLPLPQAADPADSIDQRAVLDAVDPAKDVDAFSPINVGLISQDRPRFLPCTPHGIVQLLARYDLKTAGRHVVVVGRSDIVGKPMAMLLLHRDATVTICHSKTPDLPAVCRQADILVAAIGRPGFVTRAFVKPGATVVDVGINRVTDAAVAAQLFPEGHARLAAFRAKGSLLVGDVHPDVAAVAGALTPVPGGVGPLTITMLMMNTLRAAQARAATGDRSAVGSGDGSAGRA
jgi:methylenetetrahydrofolate dehydrogenase (NADP+) / methenyltetrahydrofolate cyclohydrolase